MTPFELKQQLSQQYKILEFVDLAEISKLPSIGFKVFHDQYKETFESNERIVFYTNYHVGKKTLEYLQYAADVFNVARCFILVCSPTHIENDKDYDIEFLTTSVESEPFNDDTMISTKTLCSLPFFNLEYMNDGQVKVCCFIKDSLKSSIDGPSSRELFNSDKIKKLRQRLLNGERPSECTLCWETEDKNIESLRQWRNKSHAVEFLTDYIDNPNIKSISMRTSTICNFKCRICNYSNSSLWAEETLSHEQNPDTRQQIMQTVKNSKWFDQDLTMSEEIFDLCKDLNFIDIYGGEPLLIKQFKRIVEKSIAVGSANQQRLHFNTNCSIFPNELVPLMSQFKEVAISLSVDNIGARFELERGGVWAEIEQNIDKFLSLDPKIFKVSGLVTVSNLNLLYLDELLAWAKSKNLPLTFNILHWPTHLKYNRVTEAVRTLAIQKYSKHSNDTLRSIADDLESTQPVDVTEWLTKMRRLDEKRNQNITLSHPELAKGMGLV